MKIAHVMGPTHGGIRAHARMAAALQRADGQAVAWLELGSASGRGRLASLARLGRLARRADVIHAHGLKAGAAAVLAVRVASWLRPGRPKPRLVVTLHNYPVGPFWVRAAAAVLVRVAARADAVLAVSSDIARWASGQGARLVERALIPAPAPGPSMVESGAIRADLGIPVGHFLIVTPARLAPQKGLELLVAAAARLADRPLTWLVAGEGPLRPRLEAAINQDHLPVRLIGHRSDLIELFRSADLVVSPSLSEGQPVALQEAVLVGAAVLATAVGGTAETLGDGGQLVAPTAEAVADGIAQLMDHPEQLEALRRRARARAAELPTALDMAAQLKRIYAR